MLQRFADEAVLATCMIYLESYKTFRSPEQMKRIVALMHRQAVKAKSEGLFYKVCSDSLLLAYLLDIAYFAPRLVAYRSRALQADTRRYERRERSSRAQPRSSQTHRVHPQEILQSCSRASSSAPRGQSLRSAIES